MSGKHEHRQTAAAPQRPMILDESGLAGGLKSKRCWCSSPAGLLSSSTSLNIYFSFSGGTQIEGGDVNQTPLIDCLDRPGLSGAVTVQAWVPAPLAAVQKGIKDSDLRGKKPGSSHFLLEEVQRAVRPNSPALKEAFSGTKQLTAVVVVMAPTGMSCLLNYG